MASPQVLDFARLLQPIPGENPAGVDLRRSSDHDSVYRRIRAARADARQAERDALYGHDATGQDDQEAGPGRKGVLQNDPTPWKPILKLGPDAIAEQSKDLEITALLTEALVRAHGFAGLRDGFRLARGIVETFWDTFYPQPDEDGVSARMAPLAVLNGEERNGLLIEPLRKITITEGRTCGPFSLLEYQTASKSAMDQPHAITRDVFDKAKTETSPEWFANLLEDIAECLEQHEELCNLLEEKCGKDESGYSLAPPSSNIRNVLTECQRIVKNITKDILDTGEDEGQGVPGEEGTSLQPIPGGGVPGQVRNREEAFRALQRAAEFFRHTEPHSPVSYALEQAVRWGRLPLPELLGELISDETAREQLFKLVGIKLPEEEL